MTRIPTSATASIASLLSAASSSAPLRILWASHARWPLPRSSTSSLSTDRPERVSVSVLDSSFNPPHAAHAALADVDPSSAQLLAFTLSNADKAFDQAQLCSRLEMIRSMAIDLERKASRGDGPDKWQNVAVAVMDAPMFTTKSTLLQKQVANIVKDHGVRDVEIDLAFPVGWDTIVRIFAPRYYPPPGPDLAAQMETFLSKNRSTLYCARRGSGGPEEEERAFLESDEVRPWVERGKVHVVDLPAQVREVSSTTVRAAVKDGRWDDVERDVPFPGVVKIVKRERLYAD
ncbi:hypothetical protein JCM10212_004413 [Sporobolomyces blumeae]